MLKVTLDPATWREPRFSRLCYAMGWSKATGVGALAMFWSSSRELEMAHGHVSAIMDHMPVDSDEREKMLEAMLEAGFLKKSFGDRYEIEGNQEWLDLQNKRRASGRMGRSAMVQKVHRDRKVLKTPQESASQTWGRYEMAYRVRYGAKPVRNARTNSIIAQLVARLGIYDTPETATYFVDKCDKPAYLAAGHDLALLLKDAEAIHKAWQMHITESWTFQHSEVRRAKKQGQMELVG